MCKPNVVACVSQKVSAPEIPKFENHTASSVTNSEKTFADIAGNDEETSIDIAGRTITNH